MTQPHSLTIIQSPARIKHRENFSSNLMIFQK